MSHGEWDRLRHSGAQTALRYQVRQVQDIRNIHFDRKGRQPDHLIRVYPLSRQDASQFPWVGPVQAYPALRNDVARFLF